MSPQARSGGCLCGRVRYRVSGTPLYDTFCHCVPCQKATGTVAMSSTIRRRADLEITQGHEVLKVYEDASTDSGKPLMRNFCGECGSMLFAFPDVLDTVVGVAAGTLDDFDQWRPDTEQYCMRRAGFLEKIKDVDPSRRFARSVRSEPEAQ